MSGHRIYCYKGLKRSKAREKANDMTENRLLLLVVGRMSGEQTAAEAQELELWAGQEPAHSGFLDVFIREAQLIREIGIYDQIDPAKGFASWLATRKTAKRARLYRITRWLAAASVLVIAGVTLLIRLLPAGVKPPVAAGSASQSVEPGRDMATLTLGNGQDILLDTSGKGDLNTQEDTRVTKVDSGSIRYEHAGQQPNVLTYNILKTPRSGQYHLILADGSQVWLNSVSQLRYPIAFGPENRTVELSGEAYFEIVRDANKPFVVKVKDEAVEVLGTQFNVMAYPEEGGTQTTLLEGKVRIKAARDTANLGPGDQARVAPDGKLIILKDLPADDIVSWKSGYFYFGRAADFAAVMRQLARWYNIEVEYKGKVPKMEFGGKLPRNTKIKDLINYFNRNQIYCRLEGRKLIVL